MRTHRRGGLSRMNSSYMVGSWLALLFPWFQNRLIEQAGGQLARQCREELWLRICHRIVGMSVAEVRGYVRAQAMDSVAAEVDWTLQQHHLPPASRAKVLSSALDQLIGMMVRDVLRMTPQEGLKTVAA